jgi:hypothetical protein
MTDARQDAFSARGTSLQMSGAVGVGGVEPARTAPCEDAETAKTHDANRLPESSDARGQDAEVRTGDERRAELLTFV